MTDIHTAARETITIPKTCPYCQTVMQVEFFADECESYRAGEFICSSDECYEKDSSYDHVIVIGPCTCRVCKP